MLKNIFSVYDFKYYNININELLYYFYILKLKKKFEQK
jgi:hypothetical protein